MVSTTRCNQAAGCSYAFWLGSARLSHQGGRALQVKSSLKLHRLAICPLANRRGRVRCTVCEYVSILLLCSAGRGPNNSPCHDRSSRRPVLCVLVVPAKRQDGTSYEQLGKTKPNTHPTTDKYFATRQHLLQEISCLPFSERGTTNYSKHENSYLVCFSKLIATSHLHCSTYVNLQIDNNDIEVTDYAY